MHVEERKVLREIDKITAPLRFRLWSLFKFPASRFAGLRIVKLDSESCVVSVPGGWRTQNPFKSMYWAIQGMGAELSTGGYALAVVNSLGRRTRTLVAAQESKFRKKALGEITFSCEDGVLARKAVEESIQTGSPVSVELKSTGRDAAGDVVSEWVFKWSFSIMEKGEVS